MPNKGRDVAYPRITFHAPGKTFDRLLKESSLADLKETVKKKLGLESGSVVQFTQLRHDQPVDLEDEDDFDAFCVFAYEQRHTNVQVMSIEKSVAEDSKASAAVDLANSGSPPLYSAPVKSLKGFNYLTYPEGTNAAKPKLNLDAKGGNPSFSPVSPSGVCGTPLTPANALPGTEYLNANPSIETPGRRQKRLEEEQNEREAKSKASVEERAKREREEEEQRKEEERTENDKQAEVTVQTPRVDDSETSGQAMEDDLMQEPEELHPCKKDAKEWSREVLKINTSLLKKKHLEHLDLPKSRPPSRIALIRPLEDLSSVTYPEGIKSPKPELNVGAKEGKFRYDREFLIQFMSLCKEKPDSLPPLDAIGLVSVDPLSVTHGGSGRHRQLSGTSVPSRQASIGGGLPGAVLRGQFQSMGSFTTTPGKFSQSERFETQSNCSVSMSGANIPFHNPLLQGTASQGGVGPISSHRTCSKRGEKKFDTSKAPATVPHDPAYGQSQEQRKEEERTENERQAEVTVQIPRVNDSETSGQAMEDDLMQEPEELHFCKKDTKERSREALKINTSLLKKKHPGHLDLSKSRPPSRIALVRPLEDLNSVTYPEGIQSPKPELNVGAKGGKFRYDRDFLMQFMPICKEKPNYLFPLDSFGLKPVDSLPLTRDPGDRLVTTSMSDVMTLSSDPPLVRIGSQANPEQIPKPKTRSKRKKRSEASKAADASIEPQADEFGFGQPLTTQASNSEPLAILEMTENRWDRRTFANNDPDLPELVDGQLETLPTITPSQMEFAPSPNQSRLHKMSKPVPVTPSKATKLDSRSAWSKGLPQTTSAPSPRSQSPAPSTQPQPSHSRRTSTLRLGVQVKDGVIIPSNNIGAVKQGNPVTFGSIDDVSIPLSTSPATAPTIKSEGIQSFGAVPNIHINRKASVASRPAASPSSPIPSTSTSSTSASSTPAIPVSAAPPPNFIMDVRKLFQNPSSEAPNSSTSTKTSSPATQPLPSQISTSQPSQNAGPDSGPPPRSPTYPRQLANGTGPHSRQVPSAGPSQGPPAMSSPRLGTYPPAIPPPTPQMVAQMQPHVPWSGYYYPGVNYQPHRPLSGHHTCGVPMAPRTHPPPLQGPGTPTPSHTAPTPVPHPPPTITHIPSGSMSSMSSPPPTLASTLPSTGHLNANLNAFVPRAAARKKVVLKNQDGIEINLEDLTTKVSPTPPIPPMSARQYLLARPTRKAAPTCIETPENRRKRLEEEEQKEPEARAMAGAEEKAKEEEEGRGRRKKGGKRRKRKERLRREKEKKERLREEEERQLRQKEEEGCSMVRSYSWH